MEDYGTNPKYDGYVDGSYDQKIIALQMEYGLNKLLFDSDKRVVNEVKKFIKDKYNMSVKEYCKLFLNNDSIIWLAFPKYFKDKYKLAGNIIRVDYYGNIFDISGNLSIFQGNTGKSLLPDLGKNYLDNTISYHHTEDELDNLCECIVEEFKRRYNNEHFINFCKSDLSVSDAYNFLIFIAKYTGCTNKAISEKMGYYLKSKKFNQNPNYEEAVKYYMMNVNGIPQKYVDYAYKYRHFDGPINEWGINFFATNHLAMARGDCFPFQDEFLKSQEITRFVNNVIGEKAVLIKQVYNSNKHDFEDVEYLDNRRVRYNINEKLIMIQENYLADAPTLLADAIDKNGEPAIDLYHKLIQKYPQYKELFE